MEGNYEFEAYSGQVVVFVPTILNLKCLLCAVLENAYLRHCMLSTGLIKGIGKGFPVRGLWKPLKVLDTLLKS